EDRLLLAVRDFQVRIPSLARPYVPGSWRDEGPGVRQRRAGGRPPRQFTRGLREAIRTEEVLRRKRAARHQFLPGAAAIREPREARTARVPRLVHAGHRDRQLFWLRD